MKRLLFVSLIIMMTTGIGFAQPSVDIQGPHHTLGIGSNAQAGASAGASATGGAGGSATIYNSVDPTNTFNPTNINAVGNGVGNFSPSAKATIERGAVDVDNTNVGINKNKNVNINKPTFNNQDTNVNINKNVIEEGAVKNYNTNKQGQKQGQSQGQGQEQGQGQGQAQNNDQVVAPEQTVIIKSPVQLPNIPSSSVPELNFGNGRMYDTTKTLPKFAIFGIKPLGGDDMIMEVLNVNANVKLKNLYKAILSDAKDVANSGKKTLIDVRYQVIRVEAQKSWHTGGSLGGGGSGVSTTGLSGGAGAGSLVPSFGGTKADDLFTIIFVQVQ